MNKIIHVIEHYPPGAIYSLIKPLADNFVNHELFFANNSVKGDKIKEKIKFLNGNDKYIIHSTGRELPVFSSLLNIINQKNCKKVFIFMHVSFDYLKYNRRNKSIKMMKILSKNNITIITQSKYVSTIYNKHNIKATTICLGIESIKGIEYNERLSKYYGKIISTCTNQNSKYQKVKGINKLNKIIHSLKLNDKFIFVGSKLENSDVLSIKLNHEDFLNVLSHSLAYVQLSRYESYNITAIEAKQLKIPIILSAREGHFDSCSYGFSVHNQKETKKRLWI